MSENVTILDEIKIYSTYIPARLEGYERMLKDYSSGRGHWFIFSVCLCKNIGFSMVGENNMMKSLR